MGRLDAIKSYLKKTSKRADKLLKSKVTFRGIKKSPRATVVVDQPVYEKDKARFYKAQVEYEKRQLFFK